jgi:hypothetical protein
MGFYTTPGVRAHLLPAGPEIELVIDLREEVTPTSQAVRKPDGMVL